MARGCATVESAQDVLDKRRALDIRDKEGVYTTGRTRSAARDERQCGSSGFPEAGSQRDAPFLLWSTLRQLISWRRLVSLQQPGRAARVP